MIKDVLFDETLLDRFVKEVKEKYPKKAFGFFISDTEGGQPVDFIMFNDDVRNEWKDEFEKAFTGKSIRFDLFPLSGVGWTHCVSLFNDLSSSFRLIFYKALYNCCGQHEVCCSAVSFLSLADKTILP